jgi:outer membrane protein
MSIGTKWRACASIAALAACAVDARAQAIVEVDSAPTQLGLGIGSVPDYMGSKNNTGAIAPLFRYTFSDGYRYISWAGTQASLNLLSSRTFRLGPVLNFHAGRDDDVEDEQVKRMKEIDSTVEGGAFGEMVFADPSNKRNRTIIGATFLTAAGRERARLGARWWHQVAPQWDIHLGAGLVYGSTAYNDYYFGVNAGNRGTSTLPNYTAGNGTNEGYLTLGAAYYIDRSWMAVGGVKLARLTGDAKDSPIVAERGDKNQASFLLGGIYQWR